MHTAKQIVPFRQRKPQVLHYFEMLFMAIYARLMFPPLFHHAISSLSNLTFTGCFV